MIESENIEESNENINETVEKSIYVRLYSDFENYKKRSLKEKEDIIKTASEKVLIDIIPTLDNFERAGILGDNFDKGVYLIYENLKNVLEKHGIKEVETKGLDFNSDTMEALTQINVSDELKGKVVDVIEKGYMLNNKIIRFSKVVVGI